MSITNERIIEALQHEAAQLRGDLATERAARERAEAGLLPEQEGKAVLIQDLETERAAREKAEAERDDARRRRDDARRRYYTEAQTRIAAETALASARAAIGRVAEYVGYLEQDIAAARKNREPQTGMNVPYHGAFCSATISTIKDLERFALSMRDLLTSHPAPVAAPCAEEKK